MVVDLGMVVCNASRIELTPFPFWGCKPHPVAARLCVDVPLQLQYSARRSFCLLLPTGKGVKGAGGTGPAADGSSSQQQNQQPLSSLPQLPAELLLLERAGRSALLLTSHKLNALNSRLRDAANDCLLLTQAVRHGWPRAVLA
jgi:hypothetical protein